MGCKEGEGRSMIVLSETGQNESAKLGKTGSFRERFTVGGVRSEFCWRARWVATWVHKIKLDPFGWRGLGEAQSFRDDACVGCRLL